MNGIEEGRFSRRGDSSETGMIACTRCGRRHSDAEDALHRRLSCTEVRRYWSDIKRRHREAHGHVTQVTTDDSGRWICHTCKRRLWTPE